MAEINPAQQKDVIFAAFHNAVFHRLIDTLTPLIGKVEGEEIAQEALLKVFLIVDKSDAIDSFESQLHAMRPMVFVIAKNMALSNIRHKKVRERFHDGQRLKHANTAIKSIESTVINDHQTQMLVEAVNNLPPICRQVFIHRKIHGKSHGQIAQMLNISIKTVENHLSKGLKMCRQHMIKRHLDRSYLAQKQA